MWRGTTMPIVAKSLFSCLAKVPAEMRMLAAMTIALVWVYWMTFLELGHRWGNQSQYSHGYLVPLFAIFLLWSRRHMLPLGDLHPSWWGLAPLAGGLAMRFAGVFVEFQWLAAVSLLSCLAAACLFVG